MFDGQRREDLHMPATNRLLASGLGPVGADGAAIALLTNDARARDLLCATDFTAARIDELQFTIGQGPCLDSFVSQHPITLPDITTTALWPIFAAEVVDVLGVHGIFAFPIGADQARLGVLELHRHQPTPLSASEMEAAHTLATQLGSTILSELETYQGDPANEGQPQLSGPYQWARTHINTAIGMTAARLNVPVTEASARLRARAYAESCSISTLAHDIIERRSTIGS